MGGLFTEPGLKPTILQSASRNLLVNLPASRNPRFVQMLHTCRGRAQEGNALCPGYVRANETAT